MTVGVGRSQGSQWPALIPMLVAGILTAYTAVRYGYRWAETDSAAFIRAIRSIQSEATIEPPHAYPNGFGYQSLVIAVSEISGVSVVTLQLAVLPFLSVLVGLAAFLAIRALTGSAVVGGVGSVLLLIQPEFLFVIQRGNHEKVTHFLLLMLLYLIVRSTAREHTVSEQAGLVIAYYLTAWTLITTNSFFATTFVAGFGLVVLAAIPAFWFARTRLSDHRPALRLGYTFLGTLVLLFLFIAYVYPPAQHGVALYHIMVEQVSSLFIADESTAESPYGTIQLTWIPTWVYPVLTSYTLTIVAAAASTWVWLAVRFRKHGISRADRHLLFIWLFAAAFAVVLFVAAFIDYSGFLEANLQVRLLPVFMLLAVPLGVYGAMALYNRSNGQVRKALMYAAPVMVAFFAFVGVLKATNDPLVSNKWLFFTSDEQHAVTWIDNRLSGREVWIDIDERLRVMQDIHQPADEDNGNIYLTGVENQWAPYLLSTDVMEQRMLRMSVPLLDFRQSDRIYDNGTARVYHRVPSSPYQP